MENIQQADLEEVTPAVTEQPVVTTTEEDPLKIELEKLQRTAPKGRTKEEKLLYSKKRIEEQLKELGIEDEPEDDEDSKPVTVGMLKKLQEQTATKTALQLADEVSNETERELLKFHLENTIRSTGNPQEDLRLAQGLVNAAKNKQIIDESLRKPQATSHSSAPGSPLKLEKPQEDFTPAEIAFMRPPFNMTKEQVIAARKSEQK